MKPAMTFDPECVPFSRRGSYLAFGPLGPRRRDRPPPPAGLYLRTLHGYALPDRRVFRLTPERDGREIPVRLRQTVGRLVLAAAEGAAGKIEIAFAGPDVVRLRGRGLGLRLEAPTGEFNFARPAGPDRWEFNLASQRLQILLQVRQGRGEVDAPWEEQAAQRLGFLIQPEADGEWEIELHEFVAGWKPTRDPRPLDACASEAEEDFAAFRDALPRLPAPLARARELAAAVMWNCLVAPSGHLRRETMYMSKNGMTAVWAWDHCFNALALAKGWPALAWDQWAVLFDFQRPNGAMPDVASDTEFIVNFVKPPIHGWALRELRRSVRLSAAQKRQALGWLTRWTEWWLDYRDDDGDGIPQYNHGNDSGWDNATVFAHGMPVEAPDLSVFLILQMEECAALADELGRPARARRWRERADELFDRLMAHSWRDSRFLAPRSGDHATAPESDSLIPFMPLLLGKRLPAEIRRRLVAELFRPGRFLTPYGPATESPKSPLYRPDGYWRGPIWAPSTLLLASGLRACGERKRAADLARRFCRVCAKSGMAENFDALTGEGLREPAHTWTASGFLVLAGEYLSTGAR